MYEIIMNVLKSGNFNLTDVITKIVSLWFEGKLTDEQKCELVSAAQGYAKSVYSVDLMAKVMELEQRVLALETDSAPTEEYAEYADGKWYYAGDAVAFEGKHYKCVAPDGVVCVWSPAVYPAYWEVIE